MTNIRKAINNLNADPDVVLLQKHGLVSEFGNITALGRRVQADLQFRGGKGDQAELVEAVRAVEEQEASQE